MMHHRFQQVWRRGVETSEFDNHRTSSSLLRVQEASLRHGPSLRHLDRPVRAVGIECGNTGTIEFTQIWEGEMCCPLPHHFDQVGFLVGLVDGDSSVLKDLLQLFHGERLEVF